MQVTRVGRCISSEQKLFLFIYSSHFFFFFKYRSHALLPLYFCLVIIPIGFKKYINAYIYIILACFVHILGIFSCILHVYFGMFFVHIRAYFFQFFVHIACIGLFFVQRLVGTNITMQ
uniref:Uncharacterized protein n=1 Tax=Cacopsylla melanoneura TaxID=428564 RepID=A0A8D8Q0F2_9HEMI